MSDLLGRCSSRFAFHVLCFMFAMTDRPGKLMRDDTDNSNQIDELKTMLHSK